MEKVGCQKYTQESYERSVRQLERERKQLEAQIIVADRIRSLAKKVVEKVPSYMKRINLGLNGAETTDNSKQRLRRNPDILTESIPAWLLQTRHSERKDPSSISLRVTTEIYLATNGDLWVVDNRINSYGSSNDLVEKKFGAPRPITNEELIPLAQVTPDEIPKVYETWVKSFASLANVGVV